MKGDRGEAAAGLAPDLRGDTRNDAAAERAAAVAAAAGVATRLLGPVALEGGERRSDTLLLALTVTD